MDKRSAFEEQWKDAFEGAEVTPSADLWKNIDNQLTMQENGKYRKGFIFYRAVAAACIICLLGLGYYTWQTDLETTEKGLVTQQESSQNQQATDTAEKDKALALKQSESAEDMGNTAAQDVDPDLSEQPSLAYQKPAETTKEQGRTTGSQDLSAASSTFSGSELALSSNKQEEGLLSGRTTSSATSEAHGQNSNQKSQDATVDKALPQNKLSMGNTIAAYAENLADAALSYVSSLGPALSEEPLLSWAKDIDRLYRVPQSSSNEEREQERTRFFAGLNLATSYFDPNFSTSTNSTLEMASPDLSPMYNFSGSGGELAKDHRTMEASSVPVESGLENTPQLSLSYGVDLGLMLGERLSLESGLDFGKLSSTTQTSWVVEDFQQGERIPLLATNVKASAEANTKTQYVSEKQQLTNSFSFLSIPLKLGYHLGGEKVKFNMSSGVAANFFLNNELSDQSGQLNTVNISSDGESPFRSVYYSGIVSGGVNYKLARHYALSLSPYYNFSLGSLTESGNNFSSQPNSFGLDFGLRYNFR